jgi:hypothetical protein
MDSISNLKAVRTALCLSPRSLTYSAERAFLYP